MSVLSTVKEILEASTQDPNRGDGEPISEGAYWCDDCSVRIRDVDLPDDVTDPPTCPDCGNDMRYERSAAATGCAC